jgi:hypothetical protein
MAVIAGSSYMYSETAINDVASLEDGLDEVLQSIPRDY